MWQSSKALQTNAQLLHPQPPTLPPTQQFHTPSTSTSHPILKQCCNLSRREITIRANSSILLLLASQPQELCSLSKARAEEPLPENNIKDDEQYDDNSKISGGSNDIVSLKRAFLAVSVNGEPIGRIIIGLNVDKAPSGVARFSDLISGVSGVSYRRKEFVKIMPNYVQHGGVRSYGVDAELARRTGSSLAVDNLIEEWERQNKEEGTKNVAGSVGIIVRDPSKPPPKLKLVARKGKLEVDEEEVGKDPNGTEFVIVTGDEPELDASVLVVGRVLEGMDVVQRIGKVKTVQDNTASPYFRVAKLIGDKRAVVAERGFNRPYAKVVVLSTRRIQFWW